MTRYLLTTLCSLCAACALLLVGGCDYQGDSLAADYGYVQFHLVKASQLTEEDTRADKLEWLSDACKIKVVMQVGSKDDSLAMVNTKKVTARLRLKGEKLNQKLYELYQAGEKNLVFSVNSEVPVRDTLFHGRTDFHVDSLEFIPFSGEAVEMSAITKMVSGVKVPLFEAKMPYAALLKGLDEQLIINLEAEKDDQGRYAGLMVGSIDAPNNNAGNWE